MNLKQLFFRILGKDPEAVVVSFLSGPPESARRMLDEVVRLIPGRQHFAVTADTPLDMPGVTFLRVDEARKVLRRKRIGMAPMLLGSSHPELQRLAWRLAPLKILAYNLRLERHHIHPRTLLASWLFLRDVPLDRIYLRPRWLPSPDRTVRADKVEVYVGRSPAGPEIGVVSPYFPYPLSHGGAVRIFNLLQRASTRFDIHLFCFAEDLRPEHIEVMRAICTKLYIVRNTRYREPRWSTLLPPEVHEFRSPALRKALQEARLPLVQAEYTQMAIYEPDILVEHDVTFDLYRQVSEKRGTFSSRWDLWRWLRFERTAIRQAKRVVVMSEKDASMAAAGEKTRVIPNGADLARFVPAPEQEGSNVLFVGSFRHEPNRAAYGLLAREIWPLVKNELPSATLTVVSGSTPRVFWPEMPPPADGETRFEFVEDVRPLYAAANVVVVPTLQSAGTNLKVIEAMAMQRAMVSTSTGCQGLGLTAGEHLRIEDQPAAFAASVLDLLRNAPERRRLAANARRVAEEHYDWDRIASLQCALWEELLP